MKTKLLFGVHMHQPVDNLKEAVEEAIQKCYSPFFETMRNCPDFKFSLHCSGWLFEKIKKDYPKTFENIKYLVDCGSIELFSAGFYEPILCSIPKIDRMEQIEKLNSFLFEEFGKKPKGFWLTERVWESGLVEDLKSVGFKYAMVDDYHFIKVGFDEKYLDGYYLTEEGGESFGLFPISKRLRYDIPFKEAQDSLKSIKRSKNAAIIFDDLEKFGLWPHTHEWVYKKGWLKKFLEAILSDSQIETMHYEEYFKKYKQKGLAYIQNSSYYEMGEWSLNAKEAVELKKIKEKIGEEKAVEFLKSGIWKNFFIKYEESNRIHKRVLELSKKRVENEKYLDFLYRAECNDVFWHGIFGGLYLPNLRDNVYRYIIECENIRDEKEAVEVGDTDFDGFKEAKVVTKYLIFRFYEKFGGQMIEFDDKKTCFNWQNALTRREEAYHKDLLKNSNSKEEKEKVVTIHKMKHSIDEKEKEEIAYDWYIKNSFIDHISDESLNLENFKKCSFKEFGDFANQPFELSIEKDILNFKKDGGIYHDNFYSAVLNKNYICKDSMIEFDIDIDTTSEHLYTYGLEFNFHFASSVFVNKKDGLSDIEIFDINSIEIFDSYLKKSLSISLDHHFTLFSTPVKTLSQNENGVNFTIQGVSFILIFPFKKSLNINGILKVENV